MSEQKCPQCQESMNWTTMSASASYWYCRACKKELAEMSPQGGKVEFSKSDYDSHDSDYPSDVCPRCMSLSPCYMHIPAKSANAAITVASLAAMRARFSSIGLADPQNFKAPVFGTPVLDTHFSASYDPGEEEVIDVDTDPCDTPDEVARKVIEAIDAGARPTLRCGCTFQSIKRDCDVHAKEERQIHKHISLGMAYGMQGGNGVSKRLKELFAKDTARKMFEREYLGEFPKDAWESGQCATLEKTGVLTVLKAGTYHISGSIVGPVKTIVHGFDITVTEGDAKAFAEATFKLQVELQAQVERLMLKADNDPYDIFGDDDDSDY